MISLRISFPYELELKGTSYSNFLTDTFRTVTTPIAIFTLYLSSSLKLIFFITRKCYPRVVFKVPPLPIAICWESWGIAWSQKNFKSMLITWCKFRKCIMSSPKVSLSHLLNIVSSWYILITYNEKSWKKHPRKYLLWSKELFTSHLN